ncbi:MAG: TIGR03668 family PPOX class F420-dependent oxidoreductase [Acidimicrobiaceae bacterium]|nr:TIGR03668 family PPOX class F420-dependent oxidoreductase [Acidimicrobiaceae bacterium]MYC43393.1 TIGR03668 family PPOX class F420-dependent oxidoreductase [Acidimicrobiaceae bacterium]
MELPGVRQRVSEARSGVLSTITADGRPHAVPCCFVLDGEIVYSAVDAKPKSTLALRRLDNLAVHPEACLLVDHYEDDWSELWWIRLDCTARVLTDGDERNRALDLLAAKYPQYRSTRPPGPVIALDVTTWRWWP